MIHQNKKIDSKKNENYNNLKILIFHEVVDRKIQSNSDINPSTSVLSPWRSQSSSSVFNNDHKHPYLESTTNFFLIPPTSDNTLKPINNLQNKYLTFLSADLLDSQHNSETIQFNEDMISQFEKNSKSEKTSKIAKINFLKIEDEMNSNSLLLKNEFLRQNIEGIFMLFM